MPGERRAVTGPAKPERYVRCPRCGGQSLFGPANAWRPFCSERCKLIDLGQWATGSYRIPVEEDDRGVDHEDPAT